MPTGFQSPPPQHSAFLVHLQSNAALRRYDSRSATTSTATASLKLNRDPLGSHFLNDSADATGLDSAPRADSLYRTGNR